MSQLAAGGGQPQKQPKYAPIYTGRFFNGINTNRSPLRAATASHIYEKFYSDTSGDALIAGSNLEVSNRLTLVRRPGNPIYDTNSHTYSKPDNFDEFRVNKAAADVFGTVLEQIYTMIDETSTQSYQGMLWSLTSALQRGGDSGYNTGLNFQKSVGAGQAFMQPVGNSLYFADGVDNKKWLQSLFERTSAGDNTFLQGVDGLAGTYPFGTYLLDPATGNIQQFIGISIGRVSNVDVTSNVLTLTVTLSPDTNDYIVGTSFQLWGLTSATFLNGATITLIEPYTHGVSTTLVADFNFPDTTTSESGQAFIIQAGTTPVIAETGSSVPTWGTVVPTSSNDFMGSLTADGNTIWINRATPSTGGATAVPSVENWGIKAPLDAPEFTVAGSEEAWTANTYYSPASIYIDNNAGYLWQISTPGVTGGTQPAWPSSPTAQQKIVISSVAVAANVATFITDAQTPPLVAGDRVKIEDLCVATFLNGMTLTVLSGGLSSTGFTAAFTFTGTYAAAVDYGLAIKAGTTIADNAAVWSCIQTPASLTWQPSTHYNTGDFLVATIGGKPQFFELGPKTQPFIVGPVDLYYFVEPESEQDSSFEGSIPFWNSADTTAPAGQIYGAGTFASPIHQVLPSLRMSTLNNTGGQYQSYTINGAGLGTGAAVPFTNPVVHSWCGAITTTVFIPVAGQYTFSLGHDDGAFFSFDTSTGAYKVVGNNNNPGGAAVHKLTGKLGYGLQAGSTSGLVGTNHSGTYGTPVYGGTATNPVDSATWFFPTAGVYGVEINYANWEGEGFMYLLCPGPGVGQNIAIGRDISGTTQPVWPGFTTTGAHFNTTTQQIVWGASVVEVATAGQQYLWNNIGFVSDFIWQANTNYTLPATTIIDSNSNQEGAYETGVSGATAPVWSTAINTIVKDTNYPTLQWINEGSVPPITNPGNTITALSAQGFLYWIALVNTLDQTVSNLSPVSLATGPFEKGQVTILPGSGLDPATIDPQADYVAIFRTTDGFTTPLLIPGLVNSPYTVPLTQYLRVGYVDTIPDTELNNLIQGAQALENTPPATGAINLTFHLERIWYSIGNTVFWTTGPLAPVGNGTDGTAPGNFATCPSQVKRLVPTAIGMLVFTLSDIYIIAGSGTATSPILPAIPYLPGVGLGSYNALDMNGGLIGFFTTDKQFVIFDPSAGLSYVGFNIGDQFRLNNGTPGQSWQSANVYVAWFINGEDQGWYVADGTNGWYRLISTPAPETGSVTWSPFSTIQGSAGAIASIETSPGEHNLLVGQTGSSGRVLARDIDATTDAGTTGSNGATYPAYAVIGSVVLSNPGQIAKIAFISTVSVKTGSPLVLGVILNEALPYYKGSFDILKHWVDDPPNVPVSNSFYKQRFYLAEDEQTTAYCSDLQILVQWPAEAAQNELQALTIFGAYEVEQ